MSEPRGEWRVNVLRVAQLVAFVLFAAIFALLAVSNHLNGLETVLCLVVVFLLGIDAFSGGAA
ncbi:hypothetical protein FAM19031_000579 [Propionibacterium freudenreichii]|uniref:hypothetical protein n=1 Tax=Propionibacterium freudenreichii TaxID=1744 RepID=UPI00243443E3|nr:hypothetical protein [Propionibacterium freudenreichii]MDK9294541.1 hypothetical protein [Propionibacterium freudenreichii]MDK9359870.1 hypothetical protein [Propionibacterium freudenreichii]MDK9657903.1 hypothetical protein [Propionibacterium freudenreichii]WFF31056.1 hypothetical protein FAM19024_000244 [Propionibacterium freudenreichii]